ncbi:unnamed protein product, partial [Laminaria digitata]
IETISQSCWGNGEDTAAAAATSTAATIAAAAAAAEKANKKSSAFPVGCVVGTHLEPTHARDLFPCVDLPSAKAIFHLTLRGVPRHARAISNTPVLRVEHDAQPPRSASASASASAAVTPPEAVASATAAVAS